MKEKGIAWVPMILVLGVLVIVGVLVGPIVFKELTSSEKKKAEEELYTFVLAIEKSEAERIQKGEKDTLRNGTYELGSDGSSLAEDQLDVYKFEFAGTRPNQGWVTISDHKVSKAELRFGKYVVSYDGNVAVCTSYKEVTKIK